MPEHTLRGYRANTQESTNHGACRWSTSPLWQPTAMRSPAQSIISAFPKSCHKTKRLLLVTSTNSSGLMMRERLVL